MSDAPHRFPLRILLVDNQPDLYLASAEVLRDAGHEVHTAHDGEQALELATSLKVDVVVTDIRLPELDGLSLFRLTPLASEDIAPRIEQIAAQVSNQRQLVKARMQRARLDAPEQIVGRSTIMRRMMDRLNTIAASDAPVLLRGETGTGKELIARALHDRSPRHGKPFVVVNCASFPDFADFAAAHGGTLLLDGVGDMSAAAQVKLLRVLEEHTVEPLGTNASIPIDVRVISATHHDLREMTRAGLFRQDLYYRLNVLRLDLPPLREREGDLPLLAQYFLNRCHRRGSAPSGMSSAVWSALSAFSFPGNVRQLGHAIEHARVLAGDGEIELRHLPAEITAGARSDATTLAPPQVARAS